MLKTSLFLRQNVARIQTITLGKVRTQSQQASVDSTTIVQAPHFDGQPKQYPAKIQALVQEITKLTLVEVADLNELLRKTLNIKDMPMYAAAPGESKAMQDKAAADAAEAAAEAQSAQMQAPQKSSFKLKILKFDETKKVALIKEIKTLGENMNLVQAKKFVDSVPQIFKDKLSKDEADKLKEVLEKAGATVELE